MNKNLFDYFLQYDLKKIGIFFKIIAFLIKINIFI